MKFDDLNKKRQMAILSLMQFNAEFAETGILTNRSIKQWWNECESIKVPREIGYPIWIHEFKNPEVKGTFIVPLPGKELPTFEVKQTAKVVNASPKKEKVKELISDEEFFVECELHGVH